MSRNIETVEAWKAQLRDRIMKNLDVMLQDAAEAYQQKIADNATAPTELLYQFQSRYNYDVKNLQVGAEEQLKMEIARGERERTWAASTNWHDAGDVTQTLVEEQLAILNQIKSASPRSARHHQRSNSTASSNMSFEAYYNPTILHEAAQRSSSTVSSSTLSSNISFFDDYSEQGSSRPPTQPYPPPERSSSATSSNTSFDSLYYMPPPPVQTVKVQTASDLEARARAEKHERQQEEFRQRAEAILRRKQKERERNGGGESALEAEQPWAESMSSASSTTSASDQEPAPAFSPDSALFKAEHPMGAADVAELVQFHLQQWTWILTLPHIQWADFPWPLLSFSSPQRVSDLTLEAVAEYVVAPVHASAPQDGGDDRARVKDRLRDLIRRWHPDRFEVKYLAHVADLHEREMVREGAGIVARILNDLLAKWNDL